MASFLALASLASAAPFAETVAGGRIGDGRLATEAPVPAAGLAADGAGNLYVTDGVRVRRVDAATGVIETVAGSGVYGFCGEDGPAPAACLYGAQSLAVAPNGDVLIAEFGGRVLRLQLATGRLTRFAGRGFLECGDAAATDGIPARDACLFGRAQDVAIDGRGNVFIAESDAHRVRRVDAVTGLISTVAGTGAFEGSCEDGAPAVACALGYVYAIATDAAGNLSIASAFPSRVQRVDAATGRITTVIGGAARCSEGKGASARRACLDFPLDVATDAAGALNLLERDGRVRRIDPRRHRIRTLATFSQAWRLDVDAAGRLLVAFDGGASFGLPTRIVRLGPGGAPAEPVAGNGTAGFCGNGAPAGDACLDTPRALAVAPSGAVLLGESSRVRLIGPASDVITTVAGDGRSSYGSRTPCPDGAVATATCFNDIVDVAADGAGNLFVADAETPTDDGPLFPARLRRVDAATGLVSTVAGAPCVAGRLAEDGPAARACAGNAVEIDGAGNLYLIESARIRRIDAATGRVRTVAGNGVEGACGDGGPATRACMSARDVTVDAAGNLFIANGYAGEGYTGAVAASVRRVDAASGLISTVAGNGEPFACGDGGAATEACVPVESVVVDRDAGLLIAAFGAVRRVDPVTGIIATIAGDPAINCLGDDGSPAFDACVAADALDAAGRVLFLDRSRSRLRRVRLPCGDGVLAPDEACDDGNREAGDGCDPNCRPTGCGNGFVTAGETCDDGNRADADCCSSTCQATPGAPCNDGDACTGGDTCDAAGRCSPGSRVPCDAGPCRTAACDPMTGSCLNVALPDYSPYEDGDPCTIGEICFDGVPVPGIEYCDDRDACTEDRCVAGEGCANTLLSGAEGLLCRCRTAFDAPECEEDHDEIPRSASKQQRRACETLEDALRTRSAAQKQQMLRRAIFWLGRALETAEGLGAQGIRPRCAFAAAERLREVVAAATDALAK